MARGSEPIHDGRCESELPELRIYYLGSLHSLKGSKHLHRADTRTLASDAHELRSLIKKMDPFDPKTGRTIFISTYGAWHHRTLYREASVVTPKKPRPPLKHRAHGDEDVDDDEDKNSDVEEMDESEAQKYSSRAEGLFEWVICDEAHKLHSPKTKTSLSVSRLRAPHLILLTATPMINKPADLYGILTQIWREEWAFVKDEDDEEEPEQGPKEAERLIAELNDYAQAARELKDITF